MAVAEARWTARQHWVQVVMMGNRPIRDMTITVSGRTLMLVRIDSHSDNRARYEITGPSDFEVQGTFSDGTPFSGRCGSVTPATAPGTVPIIVNADGTLSYSDAVRP